MNSVLGVYETSGKGEGKFSVSILTAHRRMQFPERSSMNEWLRRIHGLFWHGVLALQSIDTTIKVLEIQRFLIEQDTLKE
jgi:hypothetical protein